MRNDHEDLLGSLLYAHSILRAGKYTQALFVYFLKKYIFIEFLTDMNIHVTHMIDVFF